MVEPQPKMPVYRDGFENEICCMGDQGNFQYMPNQMRLPFLDAVKLYFTTNYQFFSVLYFELGYYAFRFTM